MLDVDTIFEKYRPTFETLNARVYNAREDEDTFLLRWWFHLNESGDINRLITPDAHRLLDFLKLYRMPTTLFYSLDANNQIDNAAWFTPTDDLSKHRMAHGGVWCRSDIRGKRRQFHFTILSYSLIFEFYDAILGTTWQPELLDLHKKIGYNIVGCIPGLYDKAQCYIMHLGKNDFQESRIMKVFNNEKTNKIY